MGVGWVYWFISCLIDWLIDLQDEMKTKRLEKEQEVKLMIDSVAAQELDQLRRKHKLLIEENNELSIKVWR